MAGKGRRVVRKPTAGVSEVPLAVEDTGEPLAHCGLLFSGDPWQLEPEKDFFRRISHVTAWVPRDDPANSIDPLEGPDMNWVSEPLEAPAYAFWNISDGWSLTAVYIKELAELLGGKMDCAQENVRKLNGDGAVTHRRYVARFVPGPSGYQGGEL